MKPQLVGLQTNGETLCRFQKKQTFLNIGKSMMQKWKKRMDLKNVIKTVPDFPVKGIMYKDVTSILENPEAFRYTVTKLTDYCMRNKITDIVAPDARGFLWGSPVAIDMEVPLHIVPKSVNFWSPTYTSFYI